MGHERIALQIPQAVRDGTQPLRKGFRADTGCKQLTRALRGRLARRDLDQVFDRVRRRAEPLYYMQQSCKLEQASGVRVTGNACSVEIEQVRSARGLYFAD